MVDKFLFVIIVISQFCFEYKTLLMIVQVPCHCFHFGDPLGRVGKVAVFQRS